jgi:hypothetical protein
MLLYSILPVFVVWDKAYFYNRAGSFHMSVGFHPCQVLVVDKNVGNRKMKVWMEEKTVGNMVLVWQLEEGIVVN